MFNKLKDMGNLAKKAKEMKKQMEDIQRELKDMKINVDEHGIQVVMSGEMDLLSLKVPEGALNAGNKEKLEKAKRITYQTEIVIKTKLSSLSDILIKKLLIELCQLADTRS